MAGLHATNQLPLEDEQRSIFSIGESIEARYGGGDTYYPGTIGFVHADTQTCDVAYDDGDGEAGVAFALIRKRGSAGQSLGAAVPAAGAAAAATTATASPFSVGTEVEIRGFKGGWKLGTIAGVRDEGSFDVTLVDGCVEKGVPPSLVRLKEGASPPDTAKTPVAASGSGGQPGQQQDRGPAVAPDVAAALALAVTSKAELELKEELVMLVKAQERQQRSLDKNDKTISSLKAKIAELEATLGAAEQQRVQGTV